MKYTIENTTTGVILGTYEANTEAEALQAMAKDAGYKSANEIPNYKPEELDVYQSNE